MLGQLIPVGGGDPIPLLKPNLLVGRRPSCDIRLDFSNVSSHHCRLDFVNGYWRAEDLSRNGTKVNGERIDEKFLQPGDTVTFAKHSFEIQYTPDPDAAPPVVEEVDPFSLSLLEKAGLQTRDSRERRERARKSSSGTKSGSGNGSSPVKPTADSSIPKPPNDDDRALEWLNG